MKILIKGVKVYDRQSPHHGKVVDIAILNGKISDIAKNLKSNGYSRILSEEGLCISPGWLDIGSFNGEPGFEHREDINTLRESAARGGFIYLAPFPNSNPVLDNKSQVDFLLSKNKEHPVQFLAIGSITKDADGVDLAEIIDMQNAGAIAFSDGFSRHFSYENVLRQMQYLRGVNALGIYNSIASSFGDEGIHEGAVSVELGLEGIPYVYEKLWTQAIIDLARYSEARIHIHNISDSEALADTSGLSVSTSYLNLIYDDKEMSDYNIMLKVLPPLRPETTRKRLANAVKRGKITVINSNHRGINNEDKIREYGQAAFGAVGLETCFAALNTMCRELDTETIVHVLSTGGYEVLGQQRTVVNTGYNAELTIFNPEKQHRVDETKLMSKSKNSPFIGKSLNGVVKGVINNKKLLIFE